MGARKSGTGIPASVGISNDVQIGTHFYQYQPSLAVNNNNSNCALLYAISDFMVMTYEINPRTL